MDESSCDILDANLEDEETENRDEQPELELDDADIEHEVTPESSQNSSTIREKKRFCTNDGEIGYMKGSNFVAVTNFSVECTGYVTGNINATTAEGYLVDVIPKDSVPSSENEDKDLQTHSTAEKRESYYLTMKDMSTQMGILQVISSTKLWTAPSKEQYLPVYFKGICDEYSASTDAKRMFPVKGLGLQKATPTLTWVFGSNFQAELIEGKAKRLEKSESPYIIIKSAKTCFPFHDIEGGLDNGEALKEIIDLQYECMGDNFLPSLLVLGGLGIAVHFEQLFDQFDGVPLIMAYGTPVSGKSMAVEIALAVIGQTEKIGECTLAGVLEIIGRQSLPFWWDDADKFSVLEQLAVMIYNKSNKRTSRDKSRNSPRTVPLITMNPTALTKSIQKDKDKLLRTFSRVAVIPFTIIKKRKRALAKRFDLQTRMKRIMPELLKSVGVILELREDFLHMRDDPLFEEVIDTIEEVEELDMRTQCNYSLLLYSTAKITQKLGLLEEFFGKLKKLMVDAVLPSHLSLTQARQNEATLDGEETKVSSRAIQDVILNLVKKVIADPNKGKEFFNPRFFARKCQCGLVFGFNVGKALDFVGSKGVENTLRSYVREQSLGCNGVKVNCGQKQLMGTHIKVKFITEQLRASLYKAFDVPCEALTYPPNGNTPSDNLRDFLKETPSETERVDEKNPDNLTKTTKKKKRNNASVLHDSLSKYFAPVNDLEKRQSKKRKL